MRCILLKISQTSSKLCDKVKKGKRTDSSLLLGTERQWTGKADPCSFEAPNPSSPPDPGMGAKVGVIGEGPSGCLSTLLLVLDVPVCSNVFTVSWNWFNLNYLSIFALIILSQKKKKA